METESATRSEPKARRCLVGYFVWFVVGLITGYLAKEVHFAFDPSYTSEARVIATYSHMGTIKTALKQFKVVNKDLPTTAEGISALVKPPSRFTPKNKFMQEGDIVDPWGTVFGYSRIIEGVNPGFELWSAGPDKVHFNADDIVYRER